jgi:Flp pilus assembly protein TadD
LYYRRGAFYQRRGRHDAALADFAAGVQLDPNEPWFYVGEGDVRAARREHAAAIASYSEAIRLRPDGIPMAYLGRGSSYNSQGSFAEARSDYDKVLTDHGKGRLRRLSADDVAQAQLGRGYANLRLKEFARAKDDFDKVLTVVPASSSALQWRGYALENLGDRERALADYRAALEIAPEREWVVKRVQVLSGR